MRKAFVLVLCAATVACSDGTGDLARPTTIPSPPLPGTRSSRVAVSGVVSTAPGGNPILYPHTLVRIVQGANAGRETFSDDAGHYELRDLEPGTFTLLFSNGEHLELQRTEVVQADTTLNVQLERKGLTLSGVITTQWGEPIGDVGVEASYDGRVRGGGTSGLPSGMYRIPTLGPAEYTVRVVKWGYVAPPRTVTMTGDATLDFVLDRVRVSLFGTVREAPPCAGDIQDARVEIVSGPDTGVGVATTATGYKTARIINWGKFRLRASKTGYQPAEVSMDVVSPGSSCFSCPYVNAPVDVQQDFLLQRTGGC